MVLILPCLCKVLTPNIVERAFKTISTKDLTQWIAANASDTLLAKRRKVQSADLFSAIIGNFGEKLREAS